MINITRKNPWTAIDPTAPFRYSAAPSILQVTDTLMLAMRRFGFIATLTISVILATGAGFAEVLVVCPERFTDAVQRWVRYRTAQGYEITQISSEISADKLNREIKQRCQAHVPEAILLVGDVPSTEPADASQSVPTHYRKAEIIAPYGGDQNIATDNPYGDLDGDDVPEIPVGRFPVDRPEDLERMIARSIEYESNENFSNWRRQINLVAGVGGFGPVIDSVIENSTKTFLVTQIPAAYQTSMTQANWQSPFCPDPRNFRRTVIRRFNEGCLFWIYLGHGHLHTLDRLHVPGGAYPIFEHQDASRLDASRGSPIALLFCCYAAAYDAPDDCLAEAMLRSEGGPVAVVGGSRTTMPYAMTTFGAALIDGYFQPHPGTLGEILVRAKHELASSASTGGNRLWFDRIAGLLGHSASHRNAERHEHIQLFNLLGDPLLRLPAPESVKVTTSRIVKQGEEIQVRVESPIAGDATLELISQRGTPRKPIVDRTQLTFNDADSADLQKEYVRANNQELDRLQQEITAGDHQFHLTLPQNFVGPAHARVYIRGRGGFALGSSDIYVERLKEPKPSDGG